MRVLLILAVALVFGAMLLFDTTALVRLAGMCVTGGCGVSPMWLGIGAGVLVLVGVVATRWPFRRSKPNRKGPAKAARKKPSARPGAPKPRRGKARPAGARR